MGNQGLSFTNNDTNYLQPNQIKKSIIHPIKYGQSKLSNPQHNQYIYTKKLTFNQSNINLNNILSQHIMIQKNNELNVDIVTKNKNSKLLDQQQYQQQEQLNKIKQIFIIKPKQQKNIFIADDYQIQNHNPLTLNTYQPDNQQIIINYLPNVSKLISILKPFQTELQALDQKNVKKFKLNKSQDIYKGQFNDQYQPHGLGLVIKQNGSTLIGRFQNGFAQGDIVFIYINGSYYKGKMINSMANDHQGQFYSQQMTYIGGFQNNAFHGDCEQLGDNYYFKGFYQNNLRKKGTLSWVIKQTQKVLCQSKENQNKLQSQNQAQLPKFRDFANIPQYKFVYEGQFDVHQLFIGKGKLSDPEGYYVGDFYRGMKHGKGQYMFKSQISYLGDYDSDKRQGNGILFNCDNTIAYQGQWKNGLPNGKGCSYDLGGRKTQCQFINGLPKKIDPGHQD